MLNAATCVETSGARLTWAHVVVVGGGVCSSTLLFWWLVGVELIASQAYPPARRQIVFAMGCAAGSTHGGGAGDGNDDDGDSRSINSNYAGKWPSHGFNHVFEQKR